MSNHVFTDDEVQLIIEEYQAGRTQQDVADEIGCSQGAISDILYRHNIQTRPKKHITYTDLNTEFFKEINCEENAYFLGLLYADGCVQQYTVGLKLEKTDLDIVERFRDVMSPSSPIKMVEDKYCLFRANQSVIVDQLTALGCVPNKSLILEFPTCVPSHLMWHFLRGYTDGDGCIRKTKVKSYKSYSWKITSTKMFCDGAAAVLGQELGVHCSEDRDDNGITTSITVGGNNQAEKVLDWLYANATVYMKRKYDLYREFKEYKASRPYTEFKPLTLTEKQKQEMVELYGQGLSSLKLATMFSVSKPSVLKILHDNGVEMRPSTQEMHRLKNKEKENVDRTI